MLKERDRFLKEVAVLWDILFLTLAFLFSYSVKDIIEPYIKFSSPFPEPVLERSPVNTFHQYVLAYFLGISLWVISLAINRSYRFIRLEPFYRKAFRVFNSSLMFFFVFGTVLFVLKAAYLSRLFFFVFIISGTLALLLDKFIFVIALKKVLTQGYNSKNILVVGTGKRVAEFIKKVRLHPEWGLKIIGLINDDESRKTVEVNGIKVIGSLKNILDIFHQKVVDQVIFIIPRSRLSQIEEALHVCEIEGVETAISIDLFDMKIAHSVITEIDGLPILSYNTTRANEWQLFIKRAIDITVSSLAIIILSPVYLFSALAIKLTSPGSILFKQERVGLRGRRFWLLKFRTMRQEAEKDLSRVNNLEEMTTSDFKMKKLKYITPVGRFLRKFSLDELPQFFNVLIGDMSLVGPRPTVPGEVEKYEIWQRRRFSMKPGLTCLWQISGRNEIDHEKWMKLDLEYIDNFSLWLDLSILIKTIPAVITGRGAY